MAAFRVRFEDGILYLSGEFDMGSVTTFAEATAAIQSERDAVVLDLADLTFLDSSGLNAILLLAQRVGGRRFILRSPQPSVAKVFDIVRIGDVPGIEIERKRSEPPT